MVLVVEIEQAVNVAGDRVFVGSDRNVQPLVVEPDGVRHVAESQRGKAQSTQLEEIPVPELHLSLCLEGLPFHAHVIEVVRPNAFGPPAGTVATFLGFSFGHELLVEHLPA